VVCPSSEVEKQRDKLAEEREREGRMLTRTKDWFFQIGSIAETITSFDDPVTLRKKSERENVEPQS